MPDYFIVHWLCGGALAWTPGCWSVGLLTAVYQQAERQRMCGALTWEVVLAWSGWVITGSRN